MFIPRKFEKLRKFSFPYQLYNLGNKRENKLFLRDHLRKNGKIVTLRYLHERYRALLDRRTNIQNISTETGKNRKNTKKDLTNTLLFGSSCINSSSRKTTLRLHLSFLSRILVQMPRCATRERRLRICKRCLGILIFLPNSRSNAAPYADEILQGKSEGVGRRLRTTSTRFAFTRSTKIDDSPFGPASNSITGEFSP